MESGGPLGSVLFLEKIPAPGVYKEKDVRDRRGTILRSRLPDHDFEKSIKVRKKIQRIQGPGLTSTRTWGGGTTT